MRTLRPPGLSWRTSPSQGRLADSLNPSQPQTELIPLCRVTIYSPLLGTRTWATVGDTPMLLTIGSKHLGFEETAPMADSPQSLNSKSNRGVYVSQSLHSCGLSGHVQFCHLRGGNIPQQSRVLLLMKMGIRKSRVAYH